MEKIQTDLLIIGGGAAGLTAALAAQEQPIRILLITKGRLFAGGSTFANRNGCWGLTFAATDPERELLESTINTISCGTNVPELSRIVVEESWTAFRTLSEIGVEFQKEGDRPKRVPPCFCSEPLAALINDTRQAAAALAAHLDRTRLTTLEETAAEELLVENNRLTGVLVRRQGDGQILVECRATILACGGNAATFARNIVEPGLTGDGYALATKAGLSLRNMAYQQCVWEDIDPAAPRFPFSILLDDGYQFFADSGQLFPLRHIPLREIASRRGHVPISNLQEDRAIDASLLNALHHSPDVIIRIIKNNKMIHRIAPHAQASNGGIVIGAHGETPVAGLYAAGEVTTGMHGGDRIGGMMITSCLVFGNRAGEAAARYCRGC